MPGDNSDSVIYARARGSSISEVPRASFCPYNLRMQTCLYDVRGARTCPNERALDYEFCREHLNTPRGRQHVLDVIAQGTVTLPSEVEQVIVQARELPEKDVQSTVLEQMADALSRVLEWEESSKQRLMRIPEDDWRYRSRDGSEQMRTELKVYEQALDRTIKVLGTASKVAIRDKMVSLGRAQSELMIRILLGVVNDMRLERDMVDKARLLLLERFKEEANLTQRLENHVQKELMPVNVSDVHGMDLTNG